MDASVKRAARAMLAVDPLLSPYRAEIELRLERTRRKRQELLLCNADLTEFSAGADYFGFHRENGKWVFREWLPGTEAIWLIGDFNGWNHESHPLTRLSNDVWEICFSAEQPLYEGQHVKLWVKSGGQYYERIPAYISLTEPDPNTHRLCGIVREMHKPYAWSDGAFYAKKKNANPVIYEAHVGMAQERPGFGTYREFADFNLPYIAKAGYNTVQLMAIQEHPYYASFGYQVSNFYASCCRFGSPDDLKYLIDRAHQLGLHVLLDVVHSHACPNEGEGLNHQSAADPYFLQGDRGYHSAWGTRIFDYGRNEVLHFLLSNLRYWQEEYHFDGFRFDGVTSMIYENHGLGTSFTDYSQYFGLNVNVDALLYLTLANELVHQINPYAITIAEEMSGMPGMCLPVRKGGMGFDARLAMGVPDYWIKLLKESEFSKWDLFRLWHELTTLRPKEKSIGYCESHDQALVGDMTLMFRMIRAEMYTGMDRCYHSIGVDNAVDFHKLIRFVTMTLSGDGYLNFMGNEFGHPEWIDFPRDGNGWSHQYARRQWSLRENGYLKYGWLGEFDRAMLELAEKYRILKADQAKSLWIDPQTQMLSYERAGLLFVFNFHTEIPQTDFFVHTHLTGGGAYRVCFTSDDAAFGGENRVDMRYVYHTVNDARGQGFELYVPCRTAIVLRKVRTRAKKE